MTTFSPSLPDLRGREQEIRVAVTAELARVLCLDPTLIDCGRPFDDYGLDSIDAVVTLGAVSERIGLDLPPELFFLYPTVNRAIAALTQTEHTSGRFIPGFLVPGGRHLRPAGFPSISGLNWPRTSPSTSSTLAIGAIGCDPASVWPTLPRAPLGK